MYFLGVCFDIDGKEMMREMGNDMENWNRSYNNNHVVKIKGTVVDERNRRKVSLGDAFVFIVMTGRYAECKMVPSVYGGRHVLIQDLPENTAEVGTNSLFYFGL